MSAPTLHRTTPLTWDLSYYDLTPAQRNLVDDTLTQLGIDDTGTTTGDGHPDPAYRTAISAGLAAHIGLRLPTGDELARCTTCDTIAPTSLMREGYDNRWRCDDGNDSCNAAFEADHEVHAA